VPDADGRAVGFDLLGDEVIEHWLKLLAVLGVFGHPKAFVGTLLSTWMIGHPLAGRSNTLEPIATSFGRPPDQHP
jgi:hypothetical protein